MRLVRQQHIDGPPIPVPDRRHDRGVAVGVLGLRIRAVFQHLGKARGPTQYVEVPRMPPLIQAVQSDFSVEHGGQQALVLRLDRGSGVRVHGGHETK
jgi:hypothetical protein